MAALRKQRLEQAARQAHSHGGTQDEDAGAGPSRWYEHLNATNARPCVSLCDLADGMVPPTNADGQQRRAAARQAARKGRGPSDSWTDRSLTDRCIARGAPGWIIPGVYGAAYDITQAPGVVVIRTEIIHEAQGDPARRTARAAARHPPVDGRCERPVGGAIRRGGDDRVRRSRRVSRVRRPSE